MPSSLKRYSTSNRKKSRRTKRYVLKIKNGGGCCGGTCGRKSRKRNIGPRPLGSRKRRKRRREINFSIY